MTYSDSGDSLSFSFAYNQAQQQTQEKMYSSGTLIATVSDSYDGAGNATNITDTNSSGATCAGPNSDRICCQIMAV